jgi:nucleoside-triphosphatase
VVGGGGGGEHNTPPPPPKPPPPIPYLKREHRLPACVGTGKMPVLPVSSPTDCRGAIYCALIGLDKSSPYRGLGGGCGGKAGTRSAGVPASGSPWSSPCHNPAPRLLITGPPQCGKTTVVRRVVEGFPGRAAGFYTREVRVAGRRVGFEIVTLDGRVAWLSHVDFPGAQRVGKYGVDLEALHRVALPALAPSPGIDLMVIDEVGKMECLSPRFVAALEGLWPAPLPLLVTVAEKGGGFIAAIKRRPGARLITVTPGNRGALPAIILEMLAAP